MREPVDYAFRDELNAKRLRDVLGEATLRLSIEEIIAKRYVAVRLDDCFSDGVIYETRDDAVRSWQHGDPNQVMYIQVPAAIWTPATCDSLLWYWRTVYRNGGYRPAGAHAGTGLILPNNIERYR
jgi:hypothetical protein